jgi:23S rRNA (cytidine1920-2'-O)/16S rRNA (cytidine1409-2'-O)-methyltransferase
MWKRRWRQRARGNHLVAIGSPRRPHPFPAPESLIRVSSAPLTEPPCPFVSRGGLKLRCALDAFALDPAGLTCADFGCNVGGFTDCLLQAGAARVYAIDTGYGELAWKLRNDARVMVMERTSALRADPAALVDLVVIDMGWTPQRQAIPAALRWLAPGGRIITLIKPHYELRPEEKGLLDRGVLADDIAAQIARRTADAMPASGARLLALIPSPIRGGKGKGRRGNLEWLAHVRAESSTDEDQGLPAR